MNGMLLKRPVALSGLVEVVRSFSYKLNAGNYESRDFFASEKAQCPVEDAERVSELLYEFCRQQVLKSVGEYMKAMGEQREKKQASNERRIA